MQAATYPSAETIIVSDSVQGKNLETANEIGKVKLTSVYYRKM